MRKSVFLLLVVIGFLRGATAQHTRWDWAICNAVCPDTFLHYSDAGSLLAMDLKYRAPFYMETDTAGNLYVLGYTPKHPVLNKYPMLFDALGAKTALDFHYSANVNVYYYMKVNPAGTLMFAELIASEGIPFPYEPSQSVRLNRNTGELYMAFPGRSASYNVWVGEISPRLPAGTGVGHVLVVDRNGNYANRIEIRDAGSGVSIRKFLFPDNGKTYVLADAGKTAPDFSKPARVFVYDPVKDTVEAVFKHFSVAEYYEIRRGTNRIIGYQMAEYQPDGTQFKAALPGTALNNVKEVQQVLQKRNGNYVLKVTNLFTGQPYFLELNTTGSIRWAVQQAGVANQLAALDADDQTWIMFENVTDSMKALPPGYPTPFVARVDTSRNHSFAETFYPTNISEWSATTCFTIHGRAKYLAGSYFTQAEFADHFLEYSCQAGVLPLQQFIAKAEPGWQQTRKNLGVSAAATSGMSVFPNPANDDIRITLTADIPGPYFIYDLQGRLKFSGSVSHAGMITVATLPAGTYVVEVRTLSGKSMKTPFVKWSR